MSETEHFYRDLVPVTSFADVARFESYEPVPDDWFVLVGDIKQSTKAIEDGAYKTVNMIGAAVITSVLNACPEYDLPFVFGGDGGVVIVPRTAALAARSALAKLQAVSEEIFGLSLRAGIIPIAALRAGGHDVRIMKMQLSPGNNLAMFCGGGLEYSDNWIKTASEDEAIMIAPDKSELPDLEGLSCRWQPLATFNGTILTVMIASTDHDVEAERRLFLRITERIVTILGHPLQAAAPASDHALQLRWPPAGLALEARATAGSKWLARRYVEILFQSFVQFCCEYFAKPIGYYDPKKYRVEMRANTDFQKFDGMLRLVLDVTREQAEQIESFLNSEQALGRLNHGIHRSEDALMTCVVFDLQHSRHIHFIDGANGGYALAAAALKRNNPAPPTYAQSA